MSKADVDAVFAPRSFEQGTASVMPAKPKRAGVASCTYTSAAASPKDMLSLGLVVRQSAPGSKGVSMEAAKAGAVKLKATPVDVPGLADGAYWIDLGTQASPQYQLHVKLDTRYWLIFSSVGLRLEPNAAVQRLSTLAQTTLSRF
jgi:hypothetical protein